MNAGVPAGKSWGLIPNGSSLGRAIPGSAVFASPESSPWAALMERSVVLHMSADPGFLLQSLQTRAGFPVLSAGERDLDDSLGERAVAVFVFGGGVRGAAAVVGDLAAA